jgi:hypothetical protein
MTKAKKYRRDFIVSPDFYCWELLPIEFGNDNNSFAAMRKKYIMRFCQKQGLYHRGGHEDEIFSCFLVLSLAN